MKLAFFFRKRHPDAFSIEQLFDTLIEELSKLEQLSITRNELNHYNFSFRPILKNIQESSLLQGDVNHITGDVYSILIGLTRPTVMTIHDCNPLLRYSKWHYRYWIYRLLVFEIPMRLANVVTVISEKSRTELLQLTNCPPHKIKVVPNFVDPIFRRVPKAFNAEYPVILHVGTRANKNLLRLIDALKGIPCRLRIIGDLDTTQQAKLEQSALDWSNATRLTMEEIVTEYEKSDLIAFASTYEGFGLPILEGQVVGRPVVTSHFSPMKEVAGANACLVDPYEVPSIRAGIQHIIESPDYRSTLIQAGFENVKQYELRAIAQQYYKIYEELSGPSTKVEAFPPYSSPPTPHS